MEQFVPFLPGILFPAPSSSYDESCMFLKWISLDTNANNSDPARDIPVIHITPEEMPCENYILYSHGNGTDIGGVLDLLTFLSRELHANVIAYEYPAYGIRQKRQPHENPSSSTMLTECEAVGRFVVEKLQVPLDKIVVMGRSIGTGPACHLARYLEINYHQQCRGVVLMSAYTSIRDVARGLLPFGIGWLCPLIFDNMSNVTALHSPLCFIHGQLDCIIPASHSVTLYHSNTRSVNTLHLIDVGTHNDFSLTDDFVEPVKAFLHSTLSVFENT